LKLYEKKVFSIKVVFLVKRYSKKNYFEKLSFWKF
jgi:hypothetical protein